MGERDRAGQLAYKGAPVGDRDQRILVGQAFERGDAAARLGELVAQTVAFRREPGHPLA